MLRNRKAIYDVELVGEWKRPGTDRMEFDDYSTILYENAVEAGLDIVELTFDIRPGKVADLPQEDRWMFIDDDEVGDTYFGDIVVQTKVTARTVRDAIQTARWKFDDVLSSMDLCRDPEITWH